MVLKDMQDTAGHVGWCLLIKIITEDRVSVGTSDVLRVAQA